MKKLVVGVKFRDSGKVYYFEPEDMDLQKGDSVIVMTTNGEELGRVTLNPRMVPEENIEELFPVIRKATDNDLIANDRLIKLAEEAKQVFNTQVSSRELGMKLIDVVYTFDEKKVIFYFTAEGRVDFRDLVKDLANYFHARIELRQIGVRDEARKYAGIGVCGRSCCCSTWLSDFAPVTIKMAKEQNLSLNSTKISGVCGRLLCCLTYEQEYYEELSKRMPKIGEKLKTPDGVGTVYKLKTLEEAVLMKITNQRDEVEIKQYTLEDLDKAANEPEVKIVADPVEITPKTKDPEKITKTSKKKRETKQISNISSKISEKKKRSKTSTKSKEETKKSDSISNKKKPSRLKPNQKKNRSQVKAKSTKKRNSDRRKRQKSRRAQHK